MRAQSVIISGFLGSVIFLVVIMVLFVNIFPYISNIYIKTRNTNVHDIVYSRPLWDAKDLAIVLAEELNAPYIEVNITSINIIDNTIIDKEYYALEPLTQKVRTYYTYHFMRLSSNGILYIYNIKVGYT